MSGRRTFGLFLLAVLSLVATACGAEAPWVARSDLIEVALRGEPVDVDVMANDVVPSDARLGAVESRSADLLVTADRSGVVTAQSVGGSVGDQHHITYQVQRGDRSDTGTLIVRVVRGERPEPRLVVEPRQVDFGQAGVGEVATREVNVSLVGAGREQLSLSLSEAAPVTVVGCVTVAEADPCTLHLEWTPSEPGELDVVLQVRADGVGAVDVGVRGVAVYAAFDVEPTRIDFGPVTVGGEPSPFVASIRNTGTTSITPRVESSPPGVRTELRGCDDLAPGRTCDLLVSFDAGSQGEIVGEIVVAVPEVGSRSIELTGRIASPSFEVRPADVTITGREGERSVTITNTGLLELGDVQVSGAPDWIRAQVGSGCRRLQPDDSCEIRLSYGRDEKTSTSDVQVAVEADGAVRILAIGVQPLVASFELDPAAVTLTRERPSASIDAVNVGDVPLASITPPESSVFLTFASETCNSSVAPDESCAFEVSLTPQALRSPSLSTISSHEVTAGGVTRTLSVSVDIPPVPDFTLTPDDLYLPDNGLMHTVTLVNNGVGPLEFPEFTGLTGFGPNRDGVLTIADVSCPRSIEPGERCTFDVWLDVYPTGDVDSSTDVTATIDGVERQITVRLWTPIV